MEVVVVLGDVSQDTQAVGNFESHHVFCIQQCWNSQLLLCNTERQFVVVIDIFLLQRIEVDEVGSVFVDQSAESQAVPERRGHVGNVHIQVPFTLDPAPLLQRLHGRHPEALSRPNDPCVRLLEAPTARSPSSNTPVKVSTAAWTRWIQEMTACDRVCVSVRFKGS